MNRHYLILVVSVLFAAALTVAVGAWVFGAAGPATPALAAVPLILALLVRGLAR